MDKDLIFFVHLVVLIVKLHTHTHTQTTPSAFCDLIMLSPTHFISSQIVICTSL